MIRTSIVVALIVGACYQPSVSTAGTIQRAPNAVQVADGTATFDALLTRLHDAAVAKDARYRDCLAILAKQSFKQRMKDRTSDMMNYALLFKGVSPSTEAGRAILNQKSPIKTFSAAAALKQQIDDEVELKAAAQVMQLAMGIGNKDRATGARQSASAAAMLSRLAGPVAAGECERTIKSITAESGPSLPVHNNDQISGACTAVADIEEQVQSGVQLAAARDPAIAQIEKEVHRYNQHKKGTLAAQRIVRTTLNAASLSPDLVGPAAQAVLFGELAVTGGTEQDKLLKELYIDRRFNDRIAALQELMHLAIFNYHLGAASGNDALCACSKQLLMRLVGQRQTAQMLSPLHAGFYAGIPSGG